MLKLLMALLVGLVGAAIVHICVVLVMPRMASNDSWGRLSRLGDLFEIVRIEPQRDATPPGGVSGAGPVRPRFAFVDPAFVTVSCRFSLSEGPVRLSAAGSADFWSASIYTRQGDNVYSINDRTAVNGRFDLLVGTADQLVETRATSTTPGETLIPVGFAGEEGYLTLRVLVASESVRPGAETFLRGVSCRPDNGEAAPAA